MPVLEVTTKDDAVTPKRPWIYGDGRRNRRSMAERESVWHSQTGRCTANGQLDLSLFIHSIACGWGDLF
jgi:hypothetical protein